MHRTEGLYVVKFGNILIILKNFYIMITLQIRSLNDYLLECMCEKGEKKEGSDERKHNSLGVELNIYKKNTSKIF